MEDVLIPIVLIVLIAFAMSFVLKLLWNSTMPDVFRLPEITYWQALRLLLIALILFGSGGYKTIDPGERRVSYVEDLR